MHKLGGGWSFEFRDELETGRRRDERMASRYICFPSDESSKLGKAKKIVDAAVQSHKHVSRPVKHLESSFLCSDISKLSHGASLAVRSVVKRLGLFLLQAIPTAAAPAGS